MLVKYSFISKNGELERESQEGNHTKPVVKPILSYTSAQAALFGIIKDHLSPKINRRVKNQLPNYQPERAS